jgi:hypothetical protein
MARSGADMNAQEAQRVVDAIEEFVNEMIHQHAATDDVDGQYGIAVYHRKQTLINALRQVRKVTVVKR